ncbi:cinnamyl alcohol dehydrogenase [Colletotrichum tabaci]|uniref:Cinnamyl alcohol dehydrogenase n=1 Tax=Colletotrichum tabaci TaxID=1209068 RepID=A0AAV9TKT0_9PEZI
MPTTEYKFEGWLGLDKSAADGNMVWREFEPKPWEETDVDLRVTHSGICGTDLHTLRSGWYEAPYPICVGHEIVGVVVRVGSEVGGGIVVGDRVGVGAQADSCLGRLSATDAGPGRLALGADKVVGISRGGSKREEVLRMGADDYIATSEQPGWAGAHSGSFDIVINTVGTNKMPFGEYLGLVGVDGTFIQVGLPDDGNFEVSPMLLVSRRIRLTGSSIGSRREIREMLDLAADKDVKLWVQERPMSEANQGIVDFEAGKARYRYVLTL